MAATHKPGGGAAFDAESGAPEVESLELYVAGIECAVCARRLALHLRSRPGVESAIANPATGMLHARFRPAVLSAIHLHAEVRRAGFVPGGARLRLRLLGMHCGACAEAIERALREIPGVERASAALETGELKVDFLPDKTDADTVAETVERLGYKVERRDGDPDS